MKCILFDVGGVLVDLHGVEPLIQLCPMADSPESLQRVWSECSAVIEYESGLIDYRAFCERVVIELHLATDPGAFAELFRTFVGAVRPGAVELIESISSNIDVACLSNTNAEHALIIRKQSKLLSLFSPCLLSFETGYLKPSRRAYTHACELIGHPANEIVFLDDNMENVAAARSAGMKSELVRSIQEVATVTGVVIHGNALFDASRFIF